MTSRLVPARSRAPGAPPGFGRRARSRRGRTSLRTELGNSGMTAAERGTYLALRGARQASARRGPSRSPREIRLFATSCQRLDLTRRGLLTHGDAGVAIALENVDLSVRV